MKKIMLSVIILAICLTSIAQFEIKYNRFRYPREDYIQAGRDRLDSYNIDCNAENVRIITNLYKSIYYSDTSSMESKQDALCSLGHTNCKEVIDFYVDIFKEDSNQEMRYDALKYLGWLRAKSSIPFLMEAVQKDNDVYFVNKIA